MSEFDFDLAVAGAGGGLIAALRAAELGHNVVVIDADDQFQRGNNTSMCTAMIPAAGTRWQEKAGVEDTPRRFLEDIDRKTAGTADQRLAGALTRASAPMVTWLADELELPLELVTDFRYPGHSADRCHTITGRHGSTLLAHLVERVRRHERIELITPMTLEEVEITGGAVSGLVASTPDGARDRLSVPAVLLATNGYGGAPELVNRWIPEMAGVHYHGGFYSRGDALRIGTCLGADTAYLDAYQGHAALSASSQTLIGWATVLHGGLIVNTAGRRFADETTGYSEFASLLVAQPDQTGWIIIDEHIEQQCLAFTDFRQVAESGALVRADGLTDLAGRLKVPAETLIDEIEAAGRAARGEEEDRQGRSDERHALNGPFAAVRIVPALFHTQGGLVVDEHARVLTQKDQTPIPGLYASGGAASGISGHGAAGYLAGNGLLTAFGLAWLTAEHLGPRA
jgi:fumarate reductase flavoprotein subunit